MLLLQVINEALRCGNIVKFVHRKALKDVKYKGEMNEAPPAFRGRFHLCSSHDNGSGRGDGRTFKPDF